MAKIVPLAYLLATPGVGSRLVGFVWARFEASVAGGPSLDMMLGLSRNDCPFLVMVQT